MNNNAEDGTNTDLLNYCLADGEWLMEMFDKFKHLLIEVDAFMEQCNYHQQRQQQHEQHEQESSSNCIRMDNDVEVVVASVEQNVDHLLVSNHLHHHQV